jgi:hypothetical protein
MDEAQKKEIETLRAKLLKDPDTQKIAKNLNFELNDYAGLVAHFKVTGEEPQLFVAPDKVLKDNGFNPPTMEKLTGFIKEQKSILESSGQASSFSSLPQVKTAPVAAQQTGKTEAELKLAEDLKKQMRGKSSKG